MDTLDIVCRRRVGRRVAGLLAVFLVAACGGAATTPGTSRYPTEAATGRAEPAASATASQTASQTAQPSASPTFAAPATPRPLVLLRDSLAVTVVDHVVVRSQPRVADDSTIHSPFLPTGTELYVIGGPVDASGYRWYDVAPLTVALSGGVKHGWVAAAARDRTPWLARVVGPPTPTDVTFEQKVAEGDDAAFVAATQTVTWRAPLTTGVEIRVYGVTECLGWPADPKPDTSGPCLVAHTPLPARVLTLLATAPAPRGVVTWSWTGVSDCGSEIESPPDMAPYFAVVLAAYDASGRSTFAIAAPGRWYVPPADTVVC